MTPLIIVPGWRDSGPGHWQSLWAVLADFAPVPYQPLPYRSIIVASSNDPYCPVRTAGAYARAWGSEFVRLQKAGHINVESGFGAWPLGLALLQSLTGENAATLPTLSPLPIVHQETV